MGWKKKGFLSELGGGVESEVFVITVEMAFE